MHPHRAIGVHRSEVRFESWTFREFGRFAQGTVAGMARSCVQTRTPVDTLFRVNPFLGDFVRYKAVSRQVRGIFARHTGLIEPLSLDEAYLDVSPSG
jgi:nucleotidyltransferase/DNA polymerase involved in DNA repair